MTPNEPGPSGPLVSTAWLASHLGLPNLRIVDIRGQVVPPGTVPRYVAKQAEYAVSHIDGARFVDWTKDIVDLGDPVPMQVAPPDVFAKAMQRLGIGDESLVVAYDDYNHIFAGRLAWSLRYYGHEAAFVLDGGWVRWLAEQRPVTSKPPPDVLATFTPRPQVGLRRTAEQVSRALGRPEVLLVDARAPEQYEGRISVARRGGHIPGARNVPYRELVDSSTGMLFPSEDVGALSEAIVALGRNPDRRAQLGAAGRARVTRELSLERQADGMHRAYLAALGAHSGGSQPRSAQRPAS